MSRRITVRGATALEQALGADQKRLHASMVRACRNTAVYGRTKAMALARASGIRATGTYERDFVVVATVTGAIMANASEHAAIVELGRTPGRRAPPVGVILRWMMDKGMIPKLAGVNVRSFVSRQMKHFKHDKSLDPKSRRRIRGQLEESARRTRVSQREQAIKSAWARAWRIAKAIGRRGMKGHHIIGRTVPAMERFLKAELRKIGRGE